MEITAPHPTRVAIVDDHIIVSEMLALSVSKEADLELAGTAGNAIDALRLVKRENPDVLLMNYQLPYGDCVDTIEEILVESPKTRIVLLSAVADGDLVARARSAGCVGFLSKDCSIADVLSAIRAAIRGEVVNRTGAFSSQ
jgi:NarL family two-component system response regulator LiaR